MRLTLVACLFAIACVPKKDLPPDQIRQLTSLEDLMHVQATIADPQFKKIGAAAYTDADWVAFADAGARLQVTADKVKEVAGKGGEFDVLAARIGDQARSLESAAQSKDAAAAQAALEGLKATCKECHKKFR